MSETNRMPALFLGHGSPMNAIEDNEYSRTWQKLGSSLPVPQAVLCISAHWETRGTFLTAMAIPRTIYDFYGFPRQLYEMTYPAPGAPLLVEQVSQMVRSIEVRGDNSWGLDHGAWSVLCRMYPEANVPVMQISLNREYPGEFHYNLGRELRALRDEGVLILGSGNMVHNLQLADFNVESYDWAADYDAHLKEWILGWEHEKVVNYEKHGSTASLSVNSAEHYLPLLYVLGASIPGEPITFYNEKIMAGSISMLCVKSG